MEEITRPEIRVINCKFCLLPQWCNCPCDKCEGIRQELYAELQELSDER